jgi:hypothetical protein
MSGTNAGALAACTDTGARRAAGRLVALKAGATAILLDRAAAMLTLKLLVTLGTGNSSAGALQARGCTSGTTSIPCAVQMDEPN